MSKCRVCSPSFLAHQSQKVSLRVAEERHPQLMIGHFGQSMRPGLKRDTAGVERIARCMDVHNLEVKRAPEPFGDRLFRAAQHQAHVASLEKGHAGRRVEQMLHSQRVPIKSDSFFKVAHGETYLTDVTQCEAWIVRVHGWILHIVAWRRLLQNCFFEPLRQARGDEPVRRLNQELKLPRLSKPTEKQISVTGHSVRSRRNCARSTRQAERNSCGVIRKTALNPRKK